MHEWTIEVILYYGETGNGPLVRKVFVDTMHKSTQESSHRNNDNMHHHTIKEGKRRSRKNWLAAKMCFAGVEKVVSKAVLGMQFGRQL